MGEPVKINIFLMIHLSGLNVKDSKNLEGDIEIVYTGLRPGEKLKSCRSEAMFGTSSSILRLMRRF